MITSIRIGRLAKPSSRRQRCGAPGSPVGGPGRGQLAALATISLAGCSSSSTKSGAPSQPAATSTKAAATGGLIAFERYATKPIEETSIAQIFVGSPDGPKRQITHFKGGAFEPAWSPDGSRLVFQRRFAREHRPDQLYTMNADGSGVRALVSGCTRASGCAYDDSPVVLAGQPARRGGPRLGVRDAEPGGGRSGA